MNNIIAALAIGALLTGCGKSEEKAVRELAEKQQHQQRMQQRHAEQAAWTADAQIVQCDTGMYFAFTEEEAWGGSTAARAIHQSVLAGCTAGDQAPKARWPTG